MMENPAIAIGSRVVGTCRTMGTRHLVTVKAVTRDTWPGAYGFTVHGTDGMGHVHMLPAETCEPA